MKRLLILLPLLVLCLFYQVDDAAACIGFSYASVVNDIPSYDVMVLGTVVENSAGNSIIHVERYLKGQGDPYLLVFRQTPAYWIGGRIRNYDNGCDTPLNEIARMGTQVYIALNRNPDGTYTTDQPIQVQARYFVVHQRWEENKYVVSYQRYNGDITDTDSFNYDNLEYVTTTALEFEEEIEVLTEQTSIPPTLPYDYYYRTSADIQRRVLNVTSQNGTQYIIPIDGQHIVETAPACIVDCPIYAPDYSHALYPIPVGENTYALAYEDLPRWIATVWYEGVETMMGNYLPLHIAAQEFLFSPDSNFFLAWFDDRIIVYEIRSDFPTFYGQWPQVYELRRIELNVDDEHSAESLHGLGAWSGNSRMFAYVDAEGLKVADVLDVIAEPRLVALNEGAGLEVELSQSGRYVRYGTRQQWRLYDLLTGVVHNNTLISPDESYFVRLYQGMNPEDNTVNRTYSNLFVDIYADAPIMDFDWFGDDRLTLLVCEDESQQACNLYYHHNGHPYYRNGTYTLDEMYNYAVQQIAYDDLYGQVAVQIDDYQILYPYGLSFDLTDIIDSPIAHIEWGEPLWYVED
ncbi:MAG: hypothetical protein RLP44_18230 [Aggregatilineales bacterium]